MTGTDDKDTGEMDAAQKPAQDPGVADAGTPAQAGLTGSDDTPASELDEDEDEGGAATATPAKAAPVEGAVKADTLNRSIARFIDILVALLLSRLPDYIGFFAGLTYLGIADGLMGGRSIGKRIIGLKAVYAKDGRPADIRGSILRNSTVGLLYIISRIPFVGWALACLGLGFELLLIIGSPEGRRLGDEIADTLVVDDPRDENRAYSPET